MIQLYYLVLRILSPPALLAFHVINKRTRARRARAVLRCSDGRILLVINALGDQRWSLPGGGVGRRETDEHAIVRELHEELRIELESEKMKLLGELSVGSYTAPIFLYEIDDDEVSKLRMYRMELRDWTWTQPHDLPVDTQAYIIRALELVER